MADKKPASATPAAPAPAADKLKLPLLPILGATLGSALLVGVLMFLMMPKAPAVAGDENIQQHDEEEGGAVVETRYVEIREPLVVNLTGGGARFLQVKVQLGTRSEVGQKTIETHMPALQNALLSMLRRATPEELAQADAMDILQERARIETNRVLEAETRRKDDVSAVVFTSFVKQ